MMYAYTKSVRELPNYIAFNGINRGADIVRGGFKFRAGSLACLAGTITVIVDLKKALKEQDPLLQSILYARSFHGTVTTVYGGLTAYSYAGPLLEHLSQKYAHSPFVSKRLAIGGHWATALSERVSLLRTVAWLGWIGVLITVADLAIAGYHLYVDYTAVERWLARCTFRKTKANIGFSTANEELEVLKKAYQPK
jgi:hypothetical protein